MMVSKTRRFRELIVMGAAICLLTEAHGEPKSGRG
jgi:hypothetical protein